MSLKRSFIASALALGSLSIPVSADTYTGDLSEDLGGSVSTDTSGLYISVGAGASSTQDINHSNLDHSTDGNWAGEAALGYRFNKNFRLEGSYAFSAFEVDGSSVIEDVSVHSYFINAYYDMANDSSWTPYLGFGFGESLVDTDASFDGDETAGTRQLKLGVSYDTASNADFFGEIVWQGIDEIDVNEGTNIDNFDIWKGQVGIRFSF
ncbi:MULTISPECIES: outer membrane beta-barrel protein [Prochlorococcus]|uniref:outer membrane beta-barrel protein n=1 Tax=Prochlorococcus TaxID=1218 RepID=UPI000533AB7E|nr:MULTISPECIES: outer membrane beta-barrel protein [Prochlorococcus]KGG12168.1 hypothetical protein EV05_1373 [Prochlorococcus sp. MIT 0601]